MGGRKVYVVGVGMTHFDKPGRRTDVDYVDYALESTTKALLDANITFDAVEFAAVGYVYGESTCGQRALYQLGLTQIPVVNVNNNCSTGSTAYYLARESVASGSTECALALGFEKMAPGSLSSNWQDRTNPLDKIIEYTADLFEISAAPFAAQIFANAGTDYVKKYANGDEEAMHLIATKNHNHSTLNPYSQFKDKYSLDQVKKARRIHGALTLLHCSPTSDGSACAILASEEFVLKHNLMAQAVEIVAQVMATDSTAAFDGNNKSAIELAGADMTRTAAKKAYKIAGITNPFNDIDVIELHDCFSANELITYDALGLCPAGGACDLVKSGATTSPLFDKNKPKKRTIVNPSGGLISKGHPLGATGLAQCCELTWQIRGWTGPRQVPNIKYALQHNIGLGGAVVVTITKKPSVAADVSKWEDPRKRFGYNPAIEARPVTAENVKKVIAKKGGLSGTRTKLNENYGNEIGSTKPYALKASL